MYYNVCMGCGYEWESNIKGNTCPVCKVGDIYCELEESNDNQEQGIKGNVDEKGQTIYTYHVHKQKDSHD